MFNFALKKSTNDNIELIYHVDPGKTKQNKTKNARGIAGGGALNPRNEKRICTGVYGEPPS